ncbi:rod shape-determining protein MreC [Acetobacter conturbans]|uniref:rod shape-determining protein MreC n=1 Tax=Acetobacter conturbans TaxID=1737472 RepID=UPI001F54C702|nr:rod shape-determining protein MreC [Acetobacter conturbans]
MIPVSIQLRQALDRLLLPAMLLLSIAVMLLGWANQRFTTTARMATADVLSPLWSLVALPGTEISATFSELRSIGHLARENARLRSENETLRGWYDVAVSLTQENASLKENLHWIPDPLPSFVTGRVVGDVGGLYSHAVLLNAGPSSGVHVGDVALAADGFVGRVTETGVHSARILLIDDVASRIPVLLEASHGTAIMTGDNSTMPRLMFYAQDNHPVEGERVVTSGQADLLPAGLPIGVVHYLHAGTPVVVPYARLDHLKILRVFNFDTGAIESPDAPGRVPVTAARARGGEDRKGNPLDGMTLGGVIEGSVGRSGAASDGQGRSQSQIPGQMPGQSSGGQTFGQPSGQTPGHEQGHEQGQHQDEPDEGEEADHGAQERSSPAGGDGSSRTPKDPEQSGSIDEPSFSDHGLSGRG